MKNAFSTLCLFSVLVSSVAAHAIEATKQVTVRPLLKTSESWNGAPVSYPQGEAEVTGLIIQIAPGAQTGWHLHDVPSFGVVLEGRLEVTLKTGQKKQFKPGDAIMEVVNTFHNGRNISKVPVKLIVFYAGVKGSSLTLKEAPLAPGNPAAQPAVTGTVAPQAVVPPAAVQPAPATR
ncbi:MAG TPA: cupin domain-containing protein [Abditibacteriaceae bacterium]|jgi:quercetin dioxygenase-like cupin family protein